MIKQIPYRIEQLSPDDLNRLMAFKHQVSPLFSDFPEMNTLWHIFRFFRSKKFDIEEGYKAVKSFVEYRRMARIDGIMTRDYDDYAEIEKFIQVGRYGTDKAGRPVIIQRLGKVDHKHIMKEQYNKLRVDYFIQKFERLLFIELPMASQKVNRRIDKVVVINDFNGMSISKILDPKLKAFLRIMVDISQTNYPELVEHTFIVNMPSMLKGMYSMLQSWFNNSNGNRVSLHTSVPFDCLSEYVDVDQLPIFLGGKNEIPLSVNHGPWKKAIDSSIARKSFFLDDRSIEYEFYYTEEEKKYVNKAKGSNDLISTLSEMDSENVEHREVRYLPFRLQRFVN